MTSSPEYQRQYYLANKERILARTTARTLKWGKDNPELAQAKNRAYQAQNRERIAARKKRQREATKEQQAEYARRYYLEHKEARLATAQKWHYRNHERALDRRRKWSKDNPARCAAATRQRDAQKLQATPKWANLDAIQKIYDEAARLTRETGIPHEVDHFYPLQSKLGCGLHCEANLRITTKAKNCSKGNKWPASGPVPA